MSLQNANIATAPTSITVTGGTATAFAPSGANIPNGIQIADTNVADFYTRPTITAKTKLPVRNSDGSYSSQRQNLTVTRPKIIANGEQVFNAVKLELVFHPETTVAEITELRAMAVQALWDSDFTAFWQTGTLS